MSRFNVFKSRRVLLHDYTPTLLPHRERQLNKLGRYFEPVLCEGVNVKVHVHGPIGSGKSVLCKRFGRDLEAEAAKVERRLKYVHINLAYTPKPYQVMTRLLDQFPSVEAPKSGLSPGDMLILVAKYLSEVDCSLVLALDEVDTYIRENRDPRILYMFSRIHELYPDPVPRLSLIYVSRSLDWMRNLDEATLDTLGRVSGVHLEEYSPSEVRDILRYRAEEPFYPGAVSESIIDFIADIAVSYGGVRYALELLLESGGQAELDSARSLKAEHVRRGHANIPKGVNGAYYPSELSIHKQLLLSAVIQALQDTVCPYTSLEDVYEVYQMVCDEYGREAEKRNVIPSYLKDLELEGYILLKDGGSLVGAEFPVDHMAQTMERALKHTLQASDEP